MRARFRGLAFASLLLASACATQRPSPPPVRPAPTPLPAPTPIPPPAPVPRNAVEAGVAVAAVNYRLSPVAKYPAYLTDTAAAFAWVKQHVAGYGGDSSRVFLGGHSAGGYLALMVGLDASWLKPYGLDTRAIAGLLPVAGQTLTHYSIREERGLPRDRIIADEASPLHYVRKDAPPMLLLYAEKDMDMRREENELLAAAMHHAGHSAPHAFPAFARTD